MISVTVYFVIERCMTNKNKKWNLIDFFLCRYNKPTGRSFFQPTCQLNSHIAFTLAAAIHAWALRNPCDTTEHSGDELKYTSGADSYREIQNHGNIPTWGNRTPSKQIHVTPCRFHSGLEVCRQARWDSSWEPLAEWWAGEEYNTFDHDYTHPFPLVHSKMYRKNWRHARLHISAGDFFFFNSFNITARIRWAMISRIFASHLKCVIAADCCVFAK